MSVHDDGTMDVLVNGQPERRPYFVERLPNAGWITSRYVAETREGEQVHFVIGDDIPRIVTTRR